MHTCGLKTDGTIACWGNNGLGQLGAAPAAPSPAPPAGQVGTAYSHSFTSSTGSPPASFAVSAGTLPPGLNLGSGGVLSGTPTAGGSYTFTVTASNGLFADASEEFTVEIAANTAPVANDDSYGVDEDQTLSVSAAAGVLENDTDANSDDLTAELVEDVDNGTLTLNPDGSFTYEPDDNYNGPDSFTYTANDGQADSDTATVTITVNAVNDAPTIAVLAGNASQSACLSGTRGRITLKLADVDNNVSALTLSVVSSSNTRLVPKSNVSFAGSAETRTATITTVSGRTGSSSVTLKVSDSQASASAPVTVRAGSNDEDTLTGTGGADLLLGRDDGDALRGFGGSDVLCGAKGPDRLTGGSEADSFDGGSGTDTATDFNATEGDSKTNIP